MVVKTLEKLDQKELFRRHSLCAHNSLYYLNKFVLFKLAKHQMTANPHETVCDFIQFWRKGCSRKLLFMSRKSFKTSCVSVGDPIFDLINDPNDTLLILAQERGYAMTILGQIKRQMEENEELIAINGRDFKMSWGWKEWEIFVNGRTDWVSKEPSIATAGIDSVKAGPHPRKIILDDPETEDNTSSLEACEKLLENYRMLSPMLKQGGHRLFEEDRETARIVSDMLTDIEEGGMDAVRKYSQKFDGWNPHTTTQLALSTSPRAINP